MGEGTEYLGEGRVGAEYLEGGGVEYLEVCKYLEGGVEYLEGGECYTLTIDYLRSHPVRCTVNRSTS